MLRAIFSEMLEKGGYRCVVAANALDALRIIPS